VGQALLRTNGQRSEREAEQEQTVQEPHAGRKKRGTKKVDRSGEQSLNARARMGERLLYDASDAAPAANVR
jgi:hypothetical protein